jgi:hypothetical protein
MIDGHVEQSVALEDTYFGEGITVWGDVVVMITWKSARGFVFNKVTLQQITTFDFVTTNGQGRFSLAPAPVLNIDVFVFCALRCPVLGSTCEHGTTPPLHTFASRFTLLGGDSNMTTCSVGASHLTCLVGGSNTNGRLGNHA